MHRTCLTVLNVHPYILATKPVVCEKIIRMLEMMVQKLLRMFIVDVMVQMLLRMFIVVAEVVVVEVRVLHQLLVVAEVVVAEGEGRRKMKFIFCFQIVLNY